MAKSNVVAEFLLAAIVGMMLAMSAGPRVAKAAVSINVPGQTTSVPTKAQQQEPEEKRLMQGALQTLALEEAIGNLKARLDKPEDPVKVLGVSISKVSGSMEVYLTCAKRGPVTVVLQLADDGISWAPADYFTPFDMPTAVENAKKFLAAKSKKK